MERRIETSGRVRLGGFTLIEILATLSIIAVLAMVAYPGYVTQIQKVRRADAQAVLMQNAQYLQRIYTQAGCYNPGSDMDCNVGTPANLDLPYTQSPIDGTAKYYNIGHDASPAAGTEFQLEAVPISGTSQAGDGSLTLDDLGRKTWGGESGW